MKLTQAVLERRELPIGKNTGKQKTDHIVWDDELPGFGLRIREGGSKTYIVQYKLGKQNRRMTIGSLTKLQLKQARLEAKKLLGKVALGEDPQGTKLAARATAAETFKAVAERFLEYQAKRLRPSSLYSTSLYLMVHCKRLHSLKIEAITRREIASILSTIANNSGAVSADRARAALSALFGWAICEGVAEINPTTNTNTYAGATVRDRVLSKEEIATVWAALPDNDYGRIVKLATPGVRNFSARWANSTSNGRGSRGSIISSIQKVSAVRNGERSFCSRSSISAILASRSGAASISAR
jgi:hypothetical protein